jgi:3-oxoacyl-[acyl-carrier protein] reductase
MDLKLTGKRVVISGGSKGIGRACVQRFLEEGARVAFFARGKDAIDATVADLSKIGQVTGASVDASDGDAVTLWLDGAANSMGGIDIVVNNASGGAVGDGDRSGYGKNFNVDLMCGVAMNEAALPWFKRAGGGSIVQIATTAALEFHNLPISPSYGALKAAAIYLTSQLAQRWGALNIRANTVSPGPIQFPGGAWDHLQNALPNMYEHDREQHPLNRMGTDHEVADVVAFLSSPRASWINGVNLVVDGGFTKRVGF